VKHFPKPVNLDIEFVASNEPAIMANIFNVSLDAEGLLFLEFRQITPPIIIGGTPEEQAEKAKALGSVKAFPVARLVLTKEKFKELATIMQSVVESALK
jgi:hypothetical protein